MGELEGSLGVKVGAAEGAWATARAEGTFAAVIAAALPSTEDLRKSLREVE
jgi:hypothetical protein